MRLLILGGSGFVGRVAAEEAVRRGHEVTVFNRGHRDGPAGVRTLTGDRDFRTGLTALQTGEWDAVLDTWSGDAEAVERAVALLRGRVGHYAYVSSRSVYAYEKYTGALTEDSTVVHDSEFGYSGDKRRAEVATGAFDGPVLWARAGLILGPYEDVGRLPWWLNRLARGGPTLAPGPRELGLQYIDVRDLAIFLVDAAERRLPGAYNLVSPEAFTTIGEVLQIGAEVTGGRARLRWFEPEAILAAGIEPWTQLPLWLDPGSGDYRYLMQGDVSKALAAGMRNRPIRETVADTWSWLRSLPGPPPHRADRPRVGLDQTVEEKLLGE